jgi:thiol-disulfide isomerase/thioredoxin
MKKILCTVSIFGIISSTIAQNRIVLLEQFTNSSCPPCATASPLIYNFADANPIKTTVVAYHTSFPYPNDSMNIENPTESAARVSFYGVSGTPTVVMDGNAYQGSAGTFASTIGTRIDNRLMIAQKYTIVKNSLTRIGNQLNGQIVLTSGSASNLGENLKVQAVAVEKSVLKNSYLASPGNNSETDYGYVMRKMIPNASGTTLQHTTNGQSDTLNFSIPLLHIKNYLELKLVVFIQNTATKEVYNAALFTPTVAFLGIDSKESAIEFDLFPNPSNGTFNVQNVQNLTKIEILDLSGKIVFSQEISENVTEVNTKLSTGMYMLKASGSNGFKSQRIQIQN